MSIPQFSVNSHEKFGSLRPLCEMICLFQTIIIPKPQIKVLEDLASVSAENAVK